MANKKDICELEEKILLGLQPEFLQDLLNWAKDKYSRHTVPSELLRKVHSRNLYFKFLKHLYNSGWHLCEDGPYQIIKYLSHGEMAPMPVHIRMILDANKEKTKKYIKNIKWSSES